MTNFQSCLGFSAALLTAFSCAASDEFARLPYGQIYNVEKAQAELNRAHTNLAVALTLESTTPGVKTGDLILYIDARGGKIPITLGSGGEFAVPLRDDWLTENPWIVVNQPRGTMKLNWKVGAVLGKIERTVHYARLMQPVRDSQIVQEQMLHFFPNSPKVVATGLKLTFPSGKESAIAVIHSKDGDRKLQANGAGEIVLPLDPDLLQEDPRITLSDLPGIVEIVSRQSAD